MAPFVSVVVPTYNRAHLIKRAIDSILNQTFKDFEVIIVDDASSDNTEEIINEIKDKRVRLIKHENNKGGAAARNTGIRNAKYEWIGFLDSDDIWLETKLEEQVKVIPQLTDDYAVIHCGMRNVDYKSGENLRERTCRGDINEKVKYNLGIIPGTPTMLIRKSALEDVGLFDEQMPAHQESELGLRIAQKYKFKLVDKILVVVNKNHDQINSNAYFYIRAKEIILENHREKLSDELIFNYSNIIAGYWVVNNDIPRAKKYLKEALEHKFKFVTFLSYFMIKFSTTLGTFIYRRKYKGKGLIR